MKQLIKCSLSIVMFLLLMSLLCSNIWASINTLVFYEKNKHLFGSTLNWTSDTIKVDLITSSYTPDPSADQYYTDAGISENSATSGSITLETKTAEPDAATGEGTLGAANIVITASSTWRYFVVYKYVDGSSDPLLYYGDAGSDQDAGVYNLNWTSGVMVRID